MAIIQAPRIKLEKDPDEIIKNVQIALQRFNDQFDNAVGNAINPFNQESANSGPNTGGAGGGSLDIDSAPVINTLTPGIDTNAVNKTVEGFIDISFTPAPNTVGTEIYYREQDSTNQKPYRQSYANNTPYRLLHLLPGITYDIYLAGEAANGFIGPSSSIQSATIESEQANIAPADAHYVVTAMNADLTNEHVLQGEPTVISTTVAPTTVTVGVEPLGISTVKIADLAVTTIKIDNLAVTTGKVANDAIDNTKLTNMPALSAKVRSTNTIGDATDLVATVNNTVLSRVADTLQWVPLDGSTIPIPPPTTDSVTTASIVNNAVTDSKLADMPALSVKGQPANVVGDPTNIVAATNDRVLARQSNVLQFTQVSNLMIANDAITELKIADNAVTTNKVVDLAITNAKLANSSVGNAKIIDNAVSELKIDNNAVTTTKILDLAITNAKLADRSVTDAKLRNSIGTSVIGNATTTTGMPTDIRALSNGLILQRLNDTLAFSGNKQTLVLNTIGFNPETTVTITYVVHGFIVFIYFPSLSAVSNLTTFSIGNLVTDIRPTTDQFITIRGVDNSVRIAAMVRITTVGLVQFLATPNAANTWTASGNKGYDGFTFTYLIV